MTISHHKLCVVAYAIVKTKAETLEPNSTITTAAFVGFWPVAEVD